MESLDAIVAHEGRASTLYSWRVALRTVNKSADAEIYGSAAEAVVEHLRTCMTLDDLLHAYSSPDHALTLLLATLCTHSPIPLRPHRLLAASCALRLRQLIGECGA
ncbi:MAG TPA: hypothetical protein VGF38_21110 [Ktedonobacterales bacterium]|jgi:hypothetical protein